MEGKAPNPLDTFDHVVVLMLENRSFDNLLGYLYKDGVPEGKKFEGLQTGNYENPVPERAIDYKSGAKIAPMPTDDYHQPFPDPGEVYQHVNTQLYNTVDAENIDVDASKMVAPFNLPNSGVDNPPMNGFVNDYINTLQALDGTKGEGDWEKYIKPTKTEYENIMKCFSPESVNVLSTLAKEFAVFDHWFCSVPSQTWCNRAFWHAATSAGYVINPIGEDDEESSKTKAFIDFITWAAKMWNKKDFFGLLHEKGLKATVYAEQVPLTSLINGGPTLRYIPNPNFNPGAPDFDPTQVPVLPDPTDKTNLTYKCGLIGEGLNLGSLKPFLDDVTNNELAPYSFIEPKFIFEHNDQHPSSVNMSNDLNVFGETREGTVKLGEKLIWDVYTAIKNSDTYRDNTLLIITYDEHGGCFDHVPPPKATPPEAGMVGEKGFKFDRLGVRVPMVMVSSYIQKNTIVNDVFDHTSFIKTMCKKWGMEGLTDRDKNANSFESVFSDTKRESFPDIPEPILKKTNVDYSKDPLNDLQKTIVKGAYHAAKLTTQDKQAIAEIEKLGQPSKIKTVKGAVKFLKALQPYIIKGYL
ncbi:alkaline phosphatase family protein [Kordia sp.]|uniref:alkaline phosphatase family protein n=1 Tax=Kordia sp. TaxID=1965332 RepID=UPI003D6B68A6